MPNTSAYLGSGSIERSRDARHKSRFLSVVVPLAYGTLRERGSKLRVASRREGQYKCPIPNLNFVNESAIVSKQALLSAYRR
ncbi:MAG: hypothetical protein V7K50_12780 [Nostoc sp.]|uniref:hypothetical protein n=1 Tax=Nostoc sp. TaxID=1180 RepID=UPI002FFBDAB7